MFAVWLALSDLNGRRSRRASGDYFLILNRVGRECLEYCRGSGFGEPVVTASGAVQNG
jgi:hypothetical protein